MSDEQKTTSEDAMKTKALPQATPEHFTKEVITDIGAARQVPEHIEQLVEEGKRAGIAPTSDPTPSTAMHPRSHLPKYEGKMRGLLPDNHPAVKRRIAEMKAMRRREAERDAAAARVEAMVPQKLQLGSRVVIRGNAKVDYEDEDGRRVRGDYAGVSGEVYQTYIDTEGTRRYIIVQRDPDTGMSKYAPAAVRECDLQDLGMPDAPTQGRRFHAVPRTAEQRAELEAQNAARRATMTDEEIERAAFGGRTAEELANLMCGL